MGKEVRPVAVKCVNVVEALSRSLGVIAGGSVGDSWMKVEGSWLLHS